MTGSLKMAKLDFFTMKSQFVGYLSLVLIAMLFGSMGSSVVLLCITGAWFVALMSINIFAIQEKDHLDRLYGSVSIRLRDIVLGRYIFVFSSYFIAFLVVIALHVGFSFFQHKALEFADIMLGFSLSFLVFSAITGMQMPLFFKMGYTKAKIWSMVPFLAVMALAFIPFFVDALSGVIESMMSDKIVLIISGILLSCIIQFVSYNISVAAYHTGR